MSRSNTSPNDRSRDSERAINASTNTEDHRSGAKTCTDEVISIPVVEESLDVEVTERQRGFVRVHTSVESEPVSATVNLQHDDVQVQRITRNEDVTERRDPWEEDGVLMIPVYEEVPVTTTRLILREVIAVRRETISEDVEVRDVLRREVVEIERTGDA